MLPLSPPGTVAVDVPHIAGNHVTGAGCYHGRVGSSTPG